MRTAPAAALVVLAAMPASAHRLDEYLQGTIVSVEKNRLKAQMTLTPGVAVFPFLFSTIDTNGDGVISKAEQRAYAAQVLRDLSLSIDGRRLMPQLLSIRFPDTDEMKEGRGEIQLEFSAELPGGGRDRRITIENHHQSRISAYQVNCLVSRDPDIRIEAQKRNYTQSHYELDYVQAGGRSGSAWWSVPFGWLAAVAALLSLRVMLMRRSRGSLFSKDAQTSGRDLPSAAGIYGSGAAGTTSP
jgi:hypothetical protein